MKNRRFRHAGKRTWDVGVIEVELGDGEKAVVVVVEKEERRFFPVPPGETVHDVVVAALQTRTKAVGWWALPLMIRIEDVALVDSIRCCEDLEDCTIAEVDVLLSMQWARLAVTKILDGRTVPDAEYLAA